MAVSTTYEATLAPIEQDLRTEVGAEAQAAQATDAASDAAAVSSLTKNLYSRRRPPALEPTVHPCVEVPKSFSYPSGHSMRAFLWAAVLSDIFPDRKEALYAQAHRAAWARVVGGVHFPSDIVGGRILAAAIVSELEKNPEYRKAVEQARAEAAAFQDKKAA